MSTFSIVKEHSSIFASISIVSMSINTRNSKLGLRVSGYFQVLRGAFYRSFEIGDDFGNFYDYENFFRLFSRYVLRPREKILVPEIFYLK